LIVDEADSFLMSRHRAHRNWEVTAVNEMLTQIEAYDGWLAFTTNLMGNLDEAAMRRFDFKVEFFPMKTEQVAAMICDEMLAGKMPEGTSFEELCSTVASIKTCTPGDFAAIKRRQRVLGVSVEPSREYLNWLLHELAVEQRVKIGAVTERTIGFLR
jgi:SpoVK/Ycf46/Vps4 family AAA+-type ATPase